MEKKRYHIIIASIVFAILTWLSVNMREEHTIVRSMPVVLENLSEGKALKYPVPKTMTVRFHGNGWLLAGLYLLPDVKYFIDLSTVGPEGFMITAHDLMDHIKLPVAIQPIDVKPETLLVALEEYREKRVPIVPHFSFDFHEGYGQVGSMRIVPESVIIAGSADVIERTTEWPTQYKKFDDVHSSIDMLIPLEEAMNYSAEISARSTHLMVNVQPFAEKTFSGIPIVAIGAPPNREVIFIPPRLDIILRGGIDQLAKLVLDDFHAVVNYQNLVQDSAEVAVPNLTVPNDVKVVSRKPERVQFIIRKRL
jgi:YbbR domain-containing protein